MADPNDTVESNSLDDPANSLIQNLDDLKDTDTESLDFSTDRSIELG
jgi:hypothetical protein